MKTHKHTIHHYEDEPELLRWIPGVLFNNFWSRFPEWIRDGEEGLYEEHDDTRTTFELHVGGERHVVEYRLYNGLADFQRDFASIAKPTDVALIDLMDKGNRPHGRTVYRDVVKLLDPKTVYILTSFPTEVQLDVPDGHILPKPVDVTALVDLLIDSLGIGEET